MILFIDRCMNNNNEEVRCETNETRCTKVVQPSSGQQECSSLENFGVHDLIYSFLNVKNITTGFSKLFSMYLCQTDHCNSNQVSKEVC